MDTERIGRLVGLRYQLIWAKTRSRNGRIALFLAGYLLLICGVAVMMVGGLGAGIAAARSGKAEWIAQMVLGGVFVQALIAATTLGFGMNTIFSEQELRHYPLGARERFLARHWIGLVDPFWILFLVLDLGLVAGLSIYGGTPFGQGVFAVLLLFVTNYLLARVIGSAVERLMQGRSGSVALTAFILILALLPSLAGPVLKKRPEWIATLLGVLRVTPPFGAAAAIAHSGSAAVWGLLLVAAWAGAAGVVLVALESKPAAARRAESAKVSWDSPYERVAALCSAQHAPMIAHWLRFYLRNSRLRAMYLMAIPLAAFLVFNLSRGGDKGLLFFAALGVFPLLTFLGDARMAVNLFGYLGGGFRRYLLLPCAPETALRTGSYALLLLGAAPVPVAILGWAVLAPLPFDPRSLFLLAASAFTGLFVFHALGLWVSVLNPRKGNYSRSFGNDLSLGGNIVLIGSVIISLMLPQALRKLAPDLASPRNWWIGLATLAAGVAFFSFSLQSTCALFRRRREQLLAVVEGRD